MLPDFTEVLPESEDISVDYAEHSVHLADVWIDGEDSLVETAGDCRQHGECLEEVAEVLPDLVGSCLAFGGILSDPGECCPDIASVLPQLATPLGESAEVCPESADVLTEVTESLTDVAKNGQATGNDGRVPGETALTAKECRRSSGDN
jgi:hypothetical protein